MTFVPAKNPRKRAFEIIEIGVPEDYVSRIYDIANMISILVNLVVSILYTFDKYRNAYGSLLLAIEAVTVAFFAIDYILRLWTAKYLYPKKSELSAVKSYFISFKGIVDIFSFLPYYLPIFFPSGAVAFRMFRVMRFFRLFRINAYYDSFSVISEVIDSKRQQLLSSVFILLILMLGSSLCMYSLEHDAQPEVFTDAFSGIWWSVSTLLTIGYGDIYPITTMGKIFSIFITFLGVGMVAIPTGIISAGFVDQYSRIKHISEYANEKDINFIKIHLLANDKWTGLAIKDLRLPKGIIVAAIQRGDKIIVPRGDVVLEIDDNIVLGAPSYEDDSNHEIHIEFKEIVLRKQNKWNGHPIRELDISRQTVIIMIKRNGKSIIPNGDTVLLEGDHVIMYTHLHISHANNIEI